MGVNPDMVGGPGVGVTVNDAALVALPEGLVTVIGPVAAPDGTLVTICVVVAELTVAVMLLKNLTVFWLACELKPTPVMVTAVPTGPLAGVKLTIETAGPSRAIDRRFPTAS